ncbi:MAG: carboxypeptidase regulatory-like domain-containing protein, partial [Terriglobia bacterium]
MKSKFAIRILAIFLFPTLLAAQTTTATLVGRILDASRAPVPGAEITVRALDTNAVRTAISHSDGEYVVSGLRPAAYEVTVRKSGFRSVIVQSLVLTVNQAARLDAVLQVGTQTRTVQVKASVPLLNTENASRGAIITNQEIEQIPLNGRDFNDLAFTVPGVQPSEERAKGSAYVTNGSRADGSNVFIDGINDESTRDAGAQVSPPLDAIQEFKMKTSNYSAEYGRLGGGVVNMALKSGGNQLHGSLFEYLRNDKFDAVGYPRPLPPFPSRNELRRNQFGATLAGPVVIPRIYNGRNHTFFMFSWEGYRDVEGQSQLSQVPTALEQQGNFSQDTSKLKDPYTSGPCASSTGTFSKSIIPANCQSLAAQKLIALYPSPNISSGGFNYEASARTPDDWNHYA